MSFMQDHLKRILRPRGQRAFLSTIEADKCKILDVGCGNQSSLFLKSVKPNCIAYGIDVCDFNQSSESKGLYDEYIIAEPERFSQALRSIDESFDVVVSNHNIEHCSDPAATFAAMVERTSIGGHLFIATPSLRSKDLPSRGGNLNFFDDPTHRDKPVDLMELFALEHNRLECTFFTPSSKPLVWFLFGFLQELRSKKKNQILLGTWDYHGFEQIIWLRKIAS